MAVWVADERVHLARLQAVRRRRRARGLEEKSIMLSAAELMNKRITYPSCAKWLMNVGMISLDSESVEAGEQVEMRLRSN